MAHSVFFFLFFSFLDIWTTAEMTC